MTAAWVRDILHTDQVSLTDNIWVARHLPGLAANRSFAEEWKTHIEEGQQKTWDFTAQERLEQFYLETMLSPGELTGKVVLDAGCGNGLLSEALAKAGAKVIGVDLQPHLPRERVSENLQFVQAGFEELPFRPGSFDIIIANGTIHHTPDTHATFRVLAGLLKQQGRFYVWLYKRPDGWGKRLQLRLLDMSRFVTSRLPLPLQRLKVNALTWFFYGLSRIRKGRNSRRSREEIRTNVYDAFTPRYRHYHRPEEVAAWFYEAGFAPAVLTHWDNQYGFGLLAVKEAQGKKVPGENFSLE